MNGEKEIEELKGIINDYEDIVDEKNEEINDLKSTIEGIKELIRQMNAIL
jgi:hypothetical protein